MILLQTIIEFNQVLIISKDITVIGKTILIKKSSRNYTLLRVIINYIFRKSKENKN
jgi:hypothetical protein